MRALAFLLFLPLAGGCFFPTPLLTPHPVPEQEARGQVGLTALPVLADGVLRVGIGGGREVNARGAWAIGSESGMIGAGVMQRFTPEASELAVSGHLGLSAVLGGEEADVAGKAFVDPTILVGTRRVFGGLRANIQIAGEDPFHRAGPFMGFSVGQQTYVGFEVGLLVVYEGVGEYASPVYPTASLVFGLNRDPVREPRVPVLDPKAETLDAGE